MRRLGLEPYSIVALFITHGHIDHCAAAEAVRRLTGCRIYIGEADAPAVRGTSETDAFVDADALAQYAKERLAALDKLLRKEPPC